MPHDNIHCDRHIDNNDMDSIASLLTMKLTILAGYNKNRVSKQIIRSQFLYLVDKQMIRNQFLNRCWKI